MATLFATIVAAAKKRLLNLRLDRGRSQSECFIERLTDDIVVDQIFRYLDIEDILALRRVCLLFFTLTVEPVVWRRLLRCLPSRRIPIPILPPTPRYAIDAVKSHEVEQLILRALSVDKNWRSRRPVVHNFQSSGFFHDHVENAAVLEIATLPGGHYFVTCERRIDAATRRPYFSINVYGMDDERDRLMKLAILQLQQGGDRAFNLQARYMTINGEKSLVVGWAIRGYLYGEHAAFTRADNPEDLPRRAQSQYPMKYRFEMWRCRLEALERMMDPDARIRQDKVLETLGSPFLRLHSVYHRGWEIGTVCLDECKGRPLLALSIQPNIIIIKDLNTGDELRWTCASVIVQPVAPVNSSSNPTYFLFPSSNPPGMYSRNILRIRLLPTQDTLIALRACEGGDNRQPHYTMELYDFPKALWKPAGGWRQSPPAKPDAETDAAAEADADADEEEQEEEELLPPLPPQPPSPETPPLWAPLESASMNDGYFDDFEVSDHGFASMHDASLFPVLSQGVRPPPISIFGRTRAPSMEGLMHLSIWPLEVYSPTTASHRPAAPPLPDPSPTLKYTLMEARYQSYQAFENADHNLTMHVLPGSYRAMVYVTPGNDISAAPPITALYSYVSPEARTLRVGGREWDREKGRTVIRDRSLVAIKLPKRVSKLLMKGVTAIVWDESIGRLIFSTVESSQVHVLDFAQYRRGDRYNLIPRKTSAEVRAKAP